jgi:hypothetical protein
MTRLDDRTRRPPAPRVPGRAGILLLAVSALVATAQGKAPDLVVQARQLYNDQHYEEAIARAQAAMRLPPLADAAAVVLARAHLERYRVTSEPQDLEQARTALKGVDAARLAGRDHVEYLIGLGESIYLDTQYSLDDRYSAAAEEFELALRHADTLDPAARDRLFDWWALSLDRQAQQGPEAERRPIYQRIVTGAEAELSRSTEALSAAYWLAAGARGIDDLPRAFGAAVAGWVHAGSLGPRGAALREDLDRLILQVILPERAKQLADSADPRPVLADLESQWAQVKEKWNLPPAPVPATTPAPATP